jgi:hypothetical protein
VSIHVPAVKCKRLVRQGQTLTSRAKTAVGLYRLGKNGKQIQRLFLSAAEVFIIQYRDQIDWARSGL